MKTIAITGVLDFDTVPVILKNTLTEFKKNIPLEFDLAGVTQCNSAAFALLFEWIKMAECLKKNIIIRHLPDRLHSIATVSRINQLPGVSV